MTKPKDYSEIKVGAFIFIGLVLLILSIVILGKNEFIFKEQLRLNSKFSQAQGLAEGSLVSLAGIPVGYVTHLSMDPSDTGVIVHFDIDKNFQDQITENALATIKTQGALGDRYIYINPSIEGTPLKDGQRLPSDNKPDFLDAISERTSDFKNVGEVIQELSVLMKNLNANNRSALLMENLTKTSKNLQGITADPDLKKSLSHLSNILRKVDEGDGTLGRLINDPSVHDKILQLMGDSPRNRYLKPLIQDSIRHKADASN